MSEITHNIIDVPTPRFAHQGRKFLTLWMIIALLKLFARMDL